MLNTVSLVNIHPLTELKNNLFLVMRTFKIYSLSNFQICNTVLLTTVTMLLKVFLSKLLASRIGEKLEVGKVRGGESVHFLVSFESNLRRIQRTCHLTLMV